MQAQDSHMGIIVSHMVPFSPLHPSTMAHWGPWGCGGVKG